MFWGNGFFVLGSLLPGGHHCPHFHKAIAALGKYVLLTETHFFGDLSGRRAPEIFGVWEVVLFGESHEDVGGVVINVFQPRRLAQTLSRNRAEF